MNAPVKLSSAGPSPSIAPPQRDLSTLWALAAGAGVAVLALAAVLGWPAGTRDAREADGGLAAPSPAASEGAAKLQAALLQPDAVAMVERLATRLAATDGSAADWAMLGRSAAALGRAAQARSAYERAVAKAPADASLLTEAAEALLQARDAVAAAQAEVLLARAQRADPSHLPAWLASGNAAFARGDVEGALTAWKQALRLAPPGSEVAAMLARSLQALHAPAAAGPQTRVAGTVRLAPALQAQVQPQDVVFVYARDAAGNGPPLGTVRLSARDLPASFALDVGDWQSTSGAGGAPRWVVVARVAKGGDALPQPGDLLGRSVAVGAGTRDLQVTVTDVQR